MRPPFAEGGEGGGGVLGEGGHRPTAMAAEYSGGGGPLSGLPLEGEDRLCRRCPQRNVVAEKSAERNGQRRAKQGELRTEDAQPKQGAAARKKREQSNTLIAF